MEIKINSCKICGKNTEKNPLPKTKSGFIGHVDALGKRWMARVCSECHPKIRKERYRKPKPLPPKCNCLGCGIEFQPHQTKTKVCSPKCRLRVIRKTDRESKAKQIPVKTELKIN